MITDADVKKLEKTFATKNDLKESELRLNKRIDRMTKYVDFEIEPVTDFKKEFKDFKNKVFDKLDWLIGKYNKFEAEHTVLTEQNNRTNDKLDVHEERISGLEQRVVTP
ncbi:conserved hypothetical protein [Candidatus Roizmanbacteria bacterium]|nr:conserved hypothetical protein [Candidatus Roizmanbacteria bacterium]